MKFIFRPIASGTKLINMIPLSVLEPKNETTQDLNNIEHTNEKLGEEKTIKQEDLKELEELGYEVVIGENFHTQYS